MRPHFFSQSLLLILATLMYSCGEDRVYKKVDLSTNSEALALALTDYLIPVELEGQEKVRIGRNKDGGYVMIKDDQIDKLYSYGISHDIGFEVDFVNHWPVKSYLYDHTIDGLPEHDKQNLLFWKKEGIAATKTVNLNSLTSHIEENGDKNNQNLMLKMDVEGAEWLSLLATKDEVLLQFKQIVIEIHGLTITHQLYSEKLAVLKKLHELFYVVHIHGNNLGAVYENDVYLIPNVMEITYLRKDANIKTSQLTQTYPIQNLDYSNRFQGSDIQFNKPPFAPVQ